MSVSGTVNRVTYAGNGSTTVFSFPYYLTAFTDLVVLVTDAFGNITTETLNSTYSMTGTLDANNMYSGGASVSMDTAPPTGSILTLYRNVPETQPNTWLDGDSDPASAKITAFDRACLQIQRLMDLAIRSISLSDGYVGTFNPQIPAAPILANSPLMSNAAGTGFAFGAPANSVQGSFTAPILVTSAGVIPLVGPMFQDIYIAGSGGAVDLTAVNPQIQMPAGLVDGQRVTLIGTNATDTVKFGNGFGLSRNGSYVMGVGSISEYRFDAASALWRMMSDNEI